MSEFYPRARPTGRVFSVLADLVLSSDAFVAEHPQGLVEYCVRLGLDGRALASAAVHEASVIIDVLLSRNVEVSSLSEYASSAWVTGFYAALRASRSLPPPSLVSLRAAGSMGALYGVDDASVEYVAWQRAVRLPASVFATRQGSAAVFAALWLDAAVVGSLFDVRLAQLS